MKKALFYVAFPSLMILGCNTSPSKNATHTKDLDSIMTCASVIPSRFSSLSNDSLNYISGEDKVKMILIPGGEFRMGSADFDDAQPVHNVGLSSFWMDEHEVTNAQFKIFVESTGYVTLAERPLDPTDFPGVDPRMLVPGSAVFSVPKNVQGLTNHLQWWEYVPDANWRQPEGPNSSIIGKENHPVTQLAYQDAEAYAKWVGKRLPTEAEWEYAAKAGKHQNEIYYWGNEKKEDGKWLANIYQGEFPVNNTKEDGYETTAPVKSFPANAFGLYDMEGNVWEWCADLYRPDYYENSPKLNPRGPSEAYDPQEPGTVKRVQRGGSFLCNDQYCERYKAGSRGKGEVNSPTNNVGFRCVKDIK
ncbi:formylglycine-generating enzyme family protein [Sphingobacterium olei]|uniref:Formylglycine-generating enzyme family protein n=1 Tax=Sphingobacterium olei TaxID=2571155 RepID=A0A4U0NF90_9SPHI|nr:formylglycine-generating enzyme family protein [Sphingobacterium olei]TJZ52543.1 formylglycine-generating enzyme family protein [Sphingobacterium olei]